MPQTEPLPVPHMASCRAGAGKIPGPRAPRRWPALLLAIALGAGATFSCAALPAQQAPVKVAVSTGLSGVRIEARQVLQADADTVWSTLTDYNRLATFIPDMVSSRVISPPGAPKRVEQIADSGLFAFVMPDHVVLLMEESPNRLIRFRSVAGKVLAMNGEWQIIGDASPVTLVYRSRIIPIAPLPPLVSDYFVEDEVKKRFEAVGREAERRMREAPRGEKYR
ncbi:MAG: SRPBCC family protein [Pseudomonadota bacterium]